MYSYLTNTISYSKFKLGDKSSLNQFKETLKIGDSINSIPIQITSKTYLGEYYLSQKDTLTANTYLKNAQKLAHKNNIFEDELKILKLLQLANPKRTNLFSNRYIQLNDSLQDVERATRDKFARIEFETDEITNQKEIVSKENNTLYMRIYIISGFGILSLLVIVLWLMNKSQKAKTRELLLKQEQQKANEAIYKLMIGQQQQIDEGKNIEKQRISLELHDGVMGKLSAVRLNLYAALYKANLIEDEVFSKQIDEIQEVEKEIRTIAHDLNSNLFSDNANFIGIVKELFTKIEKHSQIHFNLQVSEAVNWDLISNGIKINLYRILQEALQNIEKYANAKNVYLIMTLKDSNEINIIISDDGIGFETNKKSTGIGIKNMKARMAELNGKINIQSELHHGTKINLTIPF
jgi:signal transduction histidine kinase